MARYYTCAIMLISACLFASIATSQEAAKPAVKRQMTVSELCEANPSVIMIRYDKNTWVTCYQVKSPAPGDLKNCRDYHGNWIECNKQ